MAYISLWNNLDTSTKKYNNGTIITTKITLMIIYFLSIPATNNISTNANKYAIAVP